jgi:hypothetical protein
MITVPTATTVLLPTNPSQFGKLLYAAWIPLLFGITLIGGFKKKRLNNWVLGGLLALLLFSLGACGSAGNSNPAPRPRNYTVTIVGASGSIRHTAKLAVTVQ